MFPAVASQVCLEENRGRTTVAARLAGYVHTAPESVPSESRQGVCRAEPTGDIRRDRKEGNTRRAAGRPKGKTPVIRERLVSHLLNIDETLAKSVGEALGLKAMPKPADAAISTRKDLEASPALSIVTNGPQRFEGRKLGILLTDGTNSTVLTALKKALAKEGASFEIIAPKVGGAKASDGNWIEADQMIDGAPSVLYDAGALLPGEAAMGALVKESTARDFVADAFAHCKFIGYVDAMTPLFEKAGIADSLDDGCVKLTSAKDVSGFITILGQMRFWEREPNIKMQ